ncbi:BamA/TamA family outer membrane protein, partial [Kaarinaea lacus]
GTKPKTKDQIRNSIDVALQSIVLLTTQNVNRSLDQLTTDDILIEPDLRDYNSSNFANQKEIIERGVAAAHKQEARLVELAVSPDTYQHWLAGRRFKGLPSLTITEITAETSGEVNTKAVLRDITTQPGKEFNKLTLHKDIVDMYGRGDFSYIGYSVIPDEDNATVVIDAEAKPWGPGYLKFGIGAATDFTSPTQLNLAMSYRRTWINTLGAEWRTDAQIGYNSVLRTEFMQPLQVGDGAFVTPYFTAQRYFIQYYDEHIRVGDYRVQTLLTGVDIGVTGTIGELKIGPYIGIVKGTPDFGILTSLIPPVDEDRTALLFTGIIDQLDRAVFPRSGYQASIQILTAKDTPLMDEYFSRSLAALTGAASFGKNTLVAHAEWGKVISGLDDFPAYERFILGGPLRLSGLYLDQLVGTQYDLETLAYYRQYASLPSQIGRGLYVGFSVESGRINDQLMKDPWDRVFAGSVFWGADTKLGALHLGYGYSSLEQDTWYLVIGPRF